MTVNSTRDFIPPEPFEGQNYKPRYARPSASLREELGQEKTFIRSSETCRFSHLYNYSGTHINTTSVGPLKFGCNNRVELHSDTKPLQIILLEV